MKRLPQALGLLAAAWLCLWACAPPTHMPPPLPLAEGRRAVGVAGGGELMLRESWVQVDSGLVLERSAVPLGNAQFWAAWRRRACLVGVTGGWAGAYQGPSGQLLLRCVGEPGRWVLGVQAETGLINGGAGVILGFEPRPGVLVSSTPVFRVGGGEPFGPFYSELSTPVGVALELREGWWLVGEARWGWRWKAEEHVALAIGVQRSW